VIAAVPRRIGINAVFLIPGMGGLDTYVRELVPELVRAAPGAQFKLYCSPQGERHLRATTWADAVEFVTHPLFGRRGLKALTEVSFLGVLAGRQVDLIHSVALTAPLWTAAANVVTIADTTWLQGHRPDLTTLLWRALVPPIARRADRVIAISQRTADDIVEHLGVPAERVDLTFLGHTRHLGVTPMPAAELRRRLDLGANRIVLMVGTRKPHKNVLGLLRAMPAVIEATPDAILVLAGNPTAHDELLRAECKQLKLDGHVRFLPFVEAAELEGLYAAAECFVLPSVKEGFGLPVLEAMARGVPVACSNASALPEVAGEAARYFDPTSVGGIADAVIEVLAQPALRTCLAALGRARASELTWEATAAATLESYARAWHAHRMDRH
jgi:glycosyltransferase involved in cell wall biosynthesis